MFSKNKVNEQQPEADSIDTARSTHKVPPAAPSASVGATTPKAKPPPSVLSADLHFDGKIRTTGDVQIEGTVKGDVSAHLLTIGDNATIEGEVTADDVVVNGRVVGRVRGLKVRLTSTARVEGDIFHKTIAIESGAYFEGSVHRQEDPLSGSSNGKRKAAAVPPVTTPINSQVNSQANTQASSAARKEAAAVSPS
ncbi:MAG: polymer-forming cytoskeletal protein [Aestuariivita sp.]|nr:polymer-forming cytoskeletal protein [Aestuariivita sp.]